MNQSGNFVGQFVYNQYQEQGLRTYMPMPVAYTDAGFGLHLATDAYSWFDLDNPGEIRIGVEADRLPLDLLTGTIAEQVSQFVALTGTPEPVPPWALGPWMSSNNWDSEAEVRRQVPLTLEHQIPATVLVIEAWSDEATFYIWNDAQYAGRSCDERALAGYRFYANLRMSLMPYLRQEAAWCVASGQPLMRAMLLDHQDDPAAVPLWDQYMFGRDLLVAPIIREGDTAREVYLPAGRWWHLFHNRWYDGGGSHAVAAPFEEIPVFLRENAALPLAFDREARLGATMPSAVDAQLDHVLLVTGSADCEGLTIGRGGDVVRLTGSVRATLIFTDPTGRIELNGVTLQVISHDLSGELLPAVVYGQLPVEV